LSERVHATYSIETAFPLEEAAAAMAGEQSTGTFTRVSGETDALRAAHGARVERLDAGDYRSRPSLPGAARPHPGAKIRRAEIELSWPLPNMGPSLPNLLATVAGNLFELQQFSGLRLLDIQLPESFAHAYAGPQFGIAGTRRLSGVEHDPLIGTIIKPSVGLSPAQTAAQAAALAEAGIDFIKDDELQASGPHNPLPQRVSAVMAALNEHAERSGKKVMYAFNITDEIDAMRRHHDTVVEAGGTCVMISLNSVGLVGLAHLRRYCALPIHAHRNGWGLFSRSPHIGMSYRAYQKFYRLAGADHMHVNGLRNKFCENDASVIESARECLRPMFDMPGKGCEVLPVFSSGQTAAQAADTYAALGYADLIYTCGGGIAGHPAGTASGVRSIRQAWDAALQGVDARTYARDHVELRQALDRFAR
jgi:ribulose-bisphosphate carboxylase large chain